MIQPELLQPFHNFNTPTIDQVGDHLLFNMEVYVDGFSDFSSLNPTEESSETSSISFFPSMLSNDLLQFSGCEDELQVGMENFWTDLEGFDPNSGDEIPSIYEYLNEGRTSFSSPELSSEDIGSPSPIKSNENLMDTTTTQQFLNLPGEDMELEIMLTIHHLLKAYGEAIERQQRDLAEVIMGCLSQKARIYGKTLERVAFNLSRDIEIQSDYLQEESSKNFSAAFKAFYQIFPYGTFAHFAANSVILQAMPEDAETIHIVDFDIGEGIQWAPMMEVLAQKQKTLRLTSIKWSEEKKDNCTTACYLMHFDETKKRLYEQARSFGLTLKVEEVGIEDLVSELKKTRKRGGGSEWFAFNCMVGLPHMGRVRSRSLVEEFLRTAKEWIANSVKKNIKNRGIIALGDGDACQKLQHCSRFGSYFESHIVHYQAILESMETTLPACLGEARMAMESLFVAPNISSHAWLKKWEELNQSCNIEVVNGLDGWRLDQETLAETTEMVHRFQSLYGVRIEGQNENEMVLEWKGTSLIKVSIWTSLS